MSTESRYEWPDGAESPTHHIVLMDLGVKYNILRLLQPHGAVA